MATNTIDAGLLAKMFLAGAKNLEVKKEWINELNVFPVPDGDTGTNMTLTIMAAAKEVAALNDPSMEQLAKAISSGSLRGARGNSGVILSQLLRGFTKEIKTVDEIDTTTLANAMVRGTETAYKAVMKPKEGTILTVAKGMADKALEMAAETDDIEVFAQAVIKEGDRVLNLTPEMLPVLKQAGVVDSGGQGLMQVIKGAFDGLTGNVTDFTLDGAEAPANGAAAKTVQTGNGAARTDIDTADIKYGYCTEFIIKLEKEYTDEDEAELKKYLGSIGDSLVVVSDDEIVKIHVHTNHPGLAFEKGLTYGSLSRMKIDNMREEHEERVIQDSERLAKEQAQADTVKQEEKEEPEERREYGFIAVSCGDGLSEIFKGIGADYLIEGGQTMNPSTEDMLNAIAHVNADHIFILPNNKNIILAANQARDLTEYKVGLIEENILRSGMTNIEAVRWDATQKDETAVEKADIVVADLPCSGLGVLGKKTDLKYKMTEETQKELVALQRKMLSTVKDYVKPGGTLVYSTCTIHEEENMGNVHWFLEQNKEFELVPIAQLLCEELKNDVVEQGCIQLLPGIHDSDGFFIAKFRKVKCE